MSTKTNKWLFLSENESRYWGSSNNVLLFTIKLKFKVFWRNTITEAAFINTSHADNVGFVSVLVFKDCPDVMWVYTGLQFSQKEVGEG